MIETVGAALTWITVVARCKWCAKPGPNVRGVAGTVIRFKCADRGCRLESEVVIK